MLFGTSITIPKSISSSDPEVVMLKIAYGIISKIMVRPRAGHQWLAHCIIRYHEHQVAPSTEGMDLHGEFFPIDWEEYLECYQPPFELKIEGWNDDDTYEHTFDIYVAVLPRTAIIATAVIDAIKGFFGMLSPKRLFSLGEEEG